MTVANSRMTFASVLGAVQTSANTITSTLNAVNAAVGMANKFVSDAAERQGVRSTLDNAIFTKTLHQEKAQELTESRLAVLQYTKQSAQHAEHYTTAYNELASLLNPN